MIKMLILSLALAGSSSFATVPSFKGSCSVLTIGSTSDDVHLLAEKTFELSVGDSVELYRSLQAEYTAKLTEFPFPSSSYDFSVVVKKSGTLLNQVSSDFDPALKFGVRFYGPNLSDIAGPSHVEVICSSKP